MSPKDTELTEKEFALLLLISYTSDKTRNHNLFPLWLLEAFNGLQSPWDIHTLITHGT